MAQRREDLPMTIRDLAALLEAEFPWPPKTAYVGDGSSVDCETSLTVARARSARGVALGFTRWEAFQASHIEEMQ